MASTGTPKPKTSNSGLERFHVHHKETDIVHARSDNLVWATCCRIRFQQFEGFNGPVKAPVDCLECLISNEPVMPLPENFLWMDED